MTVPGWSSWRRLPMGPWSRPASRRPWGCPNAMRPRRLQGWCGRWPAVSCWWCWTTASTSWRRRRAWWPRCSPSAGGCGSWPPAGNAWMFPVSWSSRCCRWGCLSMARPRRSPRPRLAFCSRPGPVRPVPPSSCRRTTQLRSRRCAGGWTASPWPSSWPRPGVRLWALPSWPHGWMAIPGCWPAVRPARADTGRWRPWCPGAMTCSARPNNGCWIACRCSGANSTLTWPNGSPVASPWHRRATRPSCRATWPGRTCTAGALSSSPGRQQARKGSPSR